MRATSSAVRPNERTDRIQQRAVTLTECIALTVILLLLLGGVLVPVPRNFQQASRQSTCVRQLQRIGEAQAIYAAENDDHIPGVNTSGVALRALMGSPASAFQNANLPVQPQDWATPLLRQSMPMPVQRAQRMRLAMEQYSCPVRPRDEAFRYASTQPPDAADFAALDPWEVPSYLMPMAFQYWGVDEHNTILAYYDAAPRIPILSRGWPTSWEVIVPSFSSRVSDVGPPSTKIFASDGTRYVTADHRIDLDISMLPGFYGAFSSSGAWLAGSTEYGVREGSFNWDSEPICNGSPSGGYNLRYTYRHGAIGEPDEAMANQGTVNAAFFDGHVENLNDEESREISLWYPSGAVVGNDPTCSRMTSLEAGYVVP